jgi:chorismate synthase
LDGAPAVSTVRSEADEPELLSGVFEGKTLGTPIAVLVRNAGHHSADYENLRELCRPGHADLGWQAKFGIRDHRGGGRSSGRETLCRVAAGAVAKKFLAAAGIRVTAWASAVAGIEMPQPGDPGFDFDEIEKNPLRAPCTAAAERALKAVAALRAGGDSAGGIVSCLARGVPPGLGEPVFGKLGARLAGAMLSIGAVKGVEFGAGFAAAAMKGSESNDAPLSPGGGNEPPVFKTNNAGGILGGISSGQGIEFKVAFKPVPSIALPQKAFNHSSGKIEDLIIGGRHDACIVPRAVPVVEAMAALAIADFLLLQRSARVQFC